MAKVDQAALNKMTKARTSLLIDQPFFGTLAMRLKMIEDTTIQTLNVNGEVMRYNPGFINSQDNELNKSAVAHEVMHCVLEHVGSNGRGITLNPKKWNYAADYAANDILKKSGFKLGEGWLWEAQYSGMSAEHIYSLIPDPPPDDKGNGGPQDEIIKGNTDPAMANAQAADWKVATVQAANAAKAAGKLHEELERFVDQLRENKVDWKTELRRFINQAAKNDYAWQRPNRKMLAAGFVLPGLYSEECGTIAVYSDESGSVDDAIVAAFSAEVSAIHEDLRPEKIVLGHFSGQVGVVEEFGPDDPFQLVRRTNGGTDFRPVIAHAESLTPTPVCTVVLTDLEGPFPEHSSSIPTLWVSVNKRKTAPWGDTLYIEV